MTEVIDPLDEIRRIRDAQAAEFNYDAKAIGLHIQELERTSGRTYLSRRPDGTECWMRYGKEVDGPTDEEKRPGDENLSKVGQKSLEKARAKLAAARTARESAA